MTIAFRQQIARAIVMGVIALIWLPVCDAADGTRWAVVVGIDQYDDPRIPRLAGAVKDAEAMAQAFIQYVEVPESNVFLLTSTGAVKPTKDEILLALNKVKKLAKSEDLVLFFFAGHGVELAGSHFLLPFDTRTADDPDRKEALLQSSGLDASVVRQAIEQMDIRHRIIMIDACRTDPLASLRQPNLATRNFETAFALQPIGGPGVRATFLSTSQGLSAYEWPALGRGFFSYLLEKGLSGEAAWPTNVTANSLSAYLNATVQVTVDREIGPHEQRPHSDVLGEEDFTLVRREVMTSRAVYRPFPAGNTRSIWGVVRNTDEMLVSDAIVTVRLRDAVDRGPTLVGGAAASTAAASTRPFATRSDEDGHFKIDGLPFDATLEIQVAHEGYESKTLVRDPAQLDDKVPINLARSRETLSALPAEPAGSTLAKLAASRGLDLVDVRSMREHATVALQNFLAEEFSAAAQSARAALAIDPDDAMAHAVLGNALAAEVTRNERFPRSRRRQVLAEAQQHIDRALVLEPSQPLAHNARGLLLYAQGNLGRARDEFLAATALDPTLSVAHANIGNVYVRQRHYADAERSFRAAIAARPDNAIPYHGLANALRQQGQYDDAVKAVRDAISHYTRRDISLAEFYVTLASAEYEAGRQEAALNAVAAARALGLPKHAAYNVIESGRPPRRR